jgi:hypothetical protein
VSEHISSEADPLGSLLGPPADLASDGTLRNRLREQTTRILRRRRYARRLMWAAALAACYLAGMATPRRLPPVSSPREMADRPQPAGSPERAVALEWRAFLSEQERASLYQRAGDQYLEKESDPESALRCYEAALDAGDDAARAVSSDDSWLLMAIKDARQKEKRDATIRN